MKILNRLFYYTKYIILKYRRRYFYMILDVHRLHVVMHRHTRHLLVTNPEILSFKVIIERDGIDTKIQNTSVKTRWNKKMSKEAFSFSVI